MSSAGELPDAFHALARTFGADHESEAQDTRPTMEEVHAFVSTHVARLLDQNPGMLMSILYRIDVPEPKVRHVFESEPHPVIVDRLTALIIERQLEKVRLRRQFREHEDD